MDCDNQLADADASDLTARTAATHLVVFQHGLLGSEEDFANVRTLFQSHLGAPHATLYAYTALCNATTLDNLFATCDGIDCGAERLACEIVRVAESMPRLAKFSLVGHSMGGLYARYCLGVLYARGFFDRIEPVNFVTLATPHLGNRRPPRGSVNRLYNAIAPRLFDRTGQQFALADEASAETVALSQRVENKYPHRVSHTAFSELDDVLSVNIEGKESAALEDVDFRPHRCELRDRVLCISSVDEPEVKPPLLRVDLTHADVILILPDMPLDNSVGEWDIRIQPQDASTTSFTLRLHGSDLASHWQWVPAISNASLAIRCATQKSPSVSLEVPSLLSCLTRGQFLQALQLFRVRTLYATVFNDHTVPYSCAAARAFNPFRSTTNDKDLQTSPCYDHILDHSLAQTPLLRDTRQQHLKTKDLSRPSPSNQTTSSQDDAKSLTTTLSSLLSNGGETTTNRPAPFSEGSVLLDRVDAAFTMDDTRDTLRAMLIAVQSVGWRRVDVRIDSLLAHEMVIAKRADATQPSDKNGLDIIYHLMDTFEV